VPEPTAHRSTHLTVDDLHVYYGDSHIVQGASLQVGDECVALLGRNGMGKTTLLRAVIGLTPPRRGSVRLDGSELKGMGPARIASLGIGYVPQGRRLFPSLSVHEHLQLTHRKSDATGAWTPDRVYELFPELAGRRRLSGARLSGGEQQMLAIGRALVLNPRLLLLDEPSEGLSPVAIDRVIEVVRHLRSDSAISVLLVEQNLRVADSLADRVYVMVTGHIVHESTGAAFAEDATSRLEYLGV
jgi:branched-chain amino acid transport system ATP-binding protein